MGQTRRGSDGRRGPWLGLVVVGAALWGLHHSVRPQPPEVVEVSEPTVAALIDDFERRRGRAPTPAQIEGLVDEWVRTELLVREARALGLDRADPIVRRRLAQKMRFVLEQAQPGAEPDDATLQRWVDAHAERYRRPPRRGFVHVFVPGHGAPAQARAERWREHLEAGGDPIGRGDAFAHGQRQAPASEAALAGRYGEAFGRAVMAAPHDRWIVAESSHGWHALRIDRHAPGEVPPLSQIRARARADLRQQQRDQSFERGLEALRTRATVEVAR